jgi:mRNA-degrading endonuclease RelE of RelBE toxin-antitoxin system
VIRKLLEDFPKDVKRVEGYKEKTFRVRVGDVRILYEVDHKNTLLGVVKIGKRPWCTNIAENFYRDYNS